MNCIAGHRERLDREDKRIDRLNYYLGQYVGAGVNDPKHYPKKPITAEEKTMQYTPDNFRQLAKRRWGKK